MPDFRSPAAEKVLSRLWLEEMQQPETVQDGGLDAGTEWGLGTILPDFGAGGVFGHSGGYHGWIACMWFQPELGEGLIVMTNGTNAEKFLNRLESVWVQDMSVRRLPWKKKPAWNR